ncbi:MAG: hypothetical protein OXI43_20960 [Candidatus Poribacteria bacterium]|nr:hypothetical protein [Candidatus Poribacteria bacterium]
MKKIRHSNVLSICYCLCIVLVLIFLYGCSGATHTISTEQGPTVESDTIVEEWKLVENPNTGIMEMRLVRKVRTTVSTSSSSTIENKGQHYPSDANNYRMILAIANFALAVVVLCIAVSE